MGKVQTSDDQPGPRVPEARFQCGYRIRQGRFHPVRMVRLRQENNARVRFLTGEEESLLREAIGEEEWPMIAIAINTGLRQGEQFKIRWEHVETSRPFSK
jgi:hypothetical protein